jgi:hypothetical protein
MRALSTLLSIGVVAAIPVASYADTFVPAGTLIQCTISEPNLSSKTAEPGDPILCYASSGVKGTILPYGTWLSGRFEDYKDPGHFVGKGWMLLTFDRMLVGSETIMPMSSKVVHVAGVNVDNHGRIIGHGHAVRDTVEWMIPVLWPVKVITLPARGPRPRLKAETRITVKVMDDLLIPDASTRLAVNSRSEAPPPQPQSPPGAFRIRPQSDRRGWSAPGGRSVEPISITQQPQATRVPDTTFAVLILKNGQSFTARAWWIEGASWLRFVSADGGSAQIPVANLDLPTTIAANQRIGVTFAIRTGSAPGWR